MKVVYSYDPEHFAFNGKREAQPDPRSSLAAKEDRYLLPRDCTTATPPAAGVGQVAVFDLETESWSLTEDHRGKTVYGVGDLQASIVEKPGPLPDDVTLDPPPSDAARWENGAWVDDTPPAPVQISKSLVIARLEAADLLDSAMAALMSDAKAFAKWTAPDRPMINVADPAAIALVTAIGGDPAVILAPE